MRETAAQPEQAGETLRGRSRFGLGKISVAPTAVHWPETCSSYNSSRFENDGKVQRRTSR